MIPFTNPIIHEPSTIHPSVMVGENCTVWQYATICEDAVLGQGVVIGSHSWVGRGVQIGNYTRIQHGAFIPNHTKIGSRVFIGPNSSMTDDKFPKAGTFYHPLPPTLEDDCSIGAGAVILPGVHIGRGAMIGAGAVVTKDVEPFTTVYGCPAE